ncbi:unnamed protein product [Lampetra planeri]
MPRRGCESSSRRTLLKSSFVFPKTTTYFWSTDPSGLFVSRGDVGNSGGETGADIVKEKQAAVILSFPDGDRRWDARLVKLVHPTWGSRAQSYGETV